MTCLRQRSVSCLFLSAGHKLGIQNGTYMVWLCQSGSGEAPSGGSSGCGGPRPEHQSEPASSSGTLEPSPLLHRSAAHVCQTLSERRPDKRTTSVLKIAIWGSVLTCILGRQVHHLLLLFPSYGPTKNS